MKHIDRDKAAGMMTEQITEPLTLLAAMREILRRAVITLAVLRDPDSRYLGLATMPQNVVHDVREAYGYSSPAVRSFQPTAYEITQAEIVLPWLAWLKREHGEEAARRFIAWSMGAQTWRLAQREKCSERTILNRIDRTVSLMIEQFTGADIKVEEIEEPYKSTPYAMIWDKSPGPHGEAVKIRKVYVGGLGMVRGGKRLRSVHETVSEKICS